MPGGVPFGTPLFVAFDANGNPLAGGKLYSYAAGTSTPLGTYVDGTLTTLNTNPVILNAAGEAHVWLTPGLSYKMDLFSALDVHQPLWPMDQLSVPSLLTPGSILPTGWTALVETNIVSAVNGVNNIRITGGLVPGRRYDAVAFLVTQQFGNANGMTSMSIGTPGGPTFWGTGLTLTAGISNGFARYGTSLYAPSAVTDIVITANGGNFTNVGAVQVTRYSIACL